jgi:hypothetical protein
VLWGPWLFATLGVGLVVRAVLLPLSHGQDFVVWDRASRATLAGINIYAHHPNYPGGPYAYFPPFLYVELPFQWLAQHTGESFVVLGKLPILAADLACAVLIASICRLRGGNEYTSAVAAAVYFVNPLVLYNSAYYGRFDSLGLALLLAAVRAVHVARTDRGRAGGAVWYALAVAAKTFPGFLLPWFLRWNSFGRWRLIGTVIAVLVLVCVPYLTTLRAVLHDVIWYDAGKQPQGLSWQYLLNGPLGVDTAKRISYVLLVLFVAAAIWLTRIADPVRYAAVVYALFIVCSKVALEQYLTWPLPFLAVLIGVGPRARAVVFAGVLSLIGLVDNESFHPLGRSSSVVVPVLALACAAYVVLDARRAPTELRAASAARTA